MKCCFARKFLFKKLLCTFAFPKCHHGKKSPLLSELYWHHQRHQNTNKAVLLQSGNFLVWAKAFSKNTAFSYWLYSEQSAPRFWLSQFDPCGQRAMVRPALQSSPRSQAGTGASMPGSYSGIRAPVSREGQWPISSSEIVTIKNKHEKRSLTKYF